MRNNAPTNNAPFDFVPAGGAVTTSRLIVDNDNCQACHDFLEFHGGARFDTQYCVTCHNPFTTDGQPPNKSVDVYRNGWIGDYVDAINFLELWTCDSGKNNSNYCDEEYDALLEEARQTHDDAARYEIYGQLEDKLVGQDGALPLSPIYWYTYPNLEKLSIKDSFTVNLLNQIDLTKVVVREQ